MRLWVILGLCVANVLSTLGCKVDTPPRVMAARLEDTTVALVRLMNADDEESVDGHPMLYCGAVWISPWCMVTAGHCAKRPGDLIRYSLPGDIVAHSDHGSFWTGRVLRNGAPKVDLAVIATEYPYPEHTYARVGREDIMVGDRVEITGHPGRYDWSYGEGRISALRPFELNAHLEPMNTIQVQYAIAPGNSGGGLFDAQGDLIGVASYGDRTAPGDGYFVHRDEVRAILVRAGCLR